MDAVLVAGDAIDLIRVGTASVAGVDQARHLRSESYWNVVSESKS